MAISDIKDRRARRAVLIAFMPLACVLLVCTVSWFAYKEAREEGWCLLCRARKVWKL